MSTSAEFKAQVQEAVAAQQRAGGFTALTHEQASQMLSWFMYRLKSDQRQALAAALPQAYNAWHGRPIVTVVSTDDREREWTP